MVLVWRVTDDSPNSPNFPLPNFPAIQYIDVSQPTFNVRLVPDKILE